MTDGTAPGKDRQAAILVLMAVQGFCAAFFLFDATTDLLTNPDSLFQGPHMVLELVATLGLIAGIAFEGAYLVRLLRRQAHVERALSVASGALHDVMESYFEQWQLTPAEADVAQFTIKGCSIAEIAELRGSAEATVKTHLNAIYRKAGLRGRAQLVNLLIEELLGGRIAQRES
ncbi:helix-turn-helix transcriptional regulator [Defluviimonas sp. WL0024]|uniref:Helix-turn-helix transcriptional regulator n=1 Tax=Albidovulum salinarum TaxID=2984153 RepID=A0ABT2WXN8_9RHOB|nr:helix-turn-helix transcriptional regulator [Defluviimonas sp. WL0024]MCU9846436.1 helix-turn-helix transcriptional regulator [Defluviimonas sp. WL0024]